MKKPPVGLRPCHIAAWNRAQEITAAMLRYSEDKKPIPLEWILELQHLINFHGFNKLNGSAAQGWIQIKE